MQLCFEFYIPKLEIEEYQAAELSNLKFFLAEIFMTFMKTYYQSVIIFSVFFVHILKMA